MILCSIKLHVVMMKLSSWQRRAKPLAERKYTICTKEYSNSRNRRSEEQKLPWAISTVNIPQKHPNEGTHI